jgi:NAD kinase
MMPMNNNSRILIISKTTELEAYEMIHGATVEEYLERTNKNILDLERRRDRHNESLEMIRDAFESRGVRPAVFRNQSITKRDLQQDWDFIIPVGGDGTYMDAARYILDDTPLFGIKSNPYSAGGHYNTHFSNAEEHIARLFSGDFSLEQRTRIEGRVKNGYNIVDLALNEIMVGDKNTAGFAKADIHINGEVYRTGSSGVVVATYKGSTGWAYKIPIIEADNERLNPIKEALRTAGLEDEANKIRIVSEDAEFKDGEENIIRYKVRETGHEGSGIGHDYGILKPGEEMTIVSKMFSGGSAIFDGNKETMSRHRVYDLPLSSEIKIRISDKPLYVVQFD